MSTFHARMAQAKRAQAEARDRGEGRGNYRGTVQPRRPDDEPTWWLEHAFARIALALAHDRAEEAAQLAWYELENSDPWLAHYTAARCIPW